MINGIGIDIIELSRIRKSLQRNSRLVHRVLTDEEIELFTTLACEQRQVEFLAGRFAAKEAFAKAAGTGIGQLSFKDITVIPKENGQPSMTVRGFETMQTFISISHSESHAIAQVILQKQDV